MARETCNNDRFVMHMLVGILLLRPVIIIKHECFNMVDGCGLRGRWLFRADCSDSEPPRNDRICRLSLRYLLPAARRARQEEEPSPWGWRQTRRPWRPWWSRWPWWTRW